MCDTCKALRLENRRLSDLLRRGRAINDRALDRLEEAVVELRALRQEAIGLRFSLREALEEAARLLGELRAEKAENAWLLRERLGVGGGGSN